MPADIHPMDIMQRETRLLARIRDLEQRVAALERGVPMPVTSTTPATTSMRAGRALILGPGVDPVAAPPQLIVKIGNSFYATNLGTTVASR